MEGIIDFNTFLLSGLILNITPGSDTVFILSRSLAQGKRAGIISALGIGSGAFTHTLLTAFGLSALVTKSVLAFTIVKYAGSCYLIYIGTKMILDNSKLNLETETTKPKESFKSIYLDGYMKNLLNPKMAIFFLAFLPQFIIPTSAHSAAPFLILGFTFTATGTLWCVMLATFVGHIFSGLRENPKFSLVLNKFCGAILILLGLFVAISGNFR